MTDKPITIFYSWQSWRNTTRNRQFIEEVLERALKQIEDTEGHTLVIDRETKGLLGAPAIADAILQKISQDL